MLREYMYGDLCIQQSREKQSCARTADGCHFNLVFVHSVFGPQRIRWMHVVTAIFETYYLWPIVLGRILFKFSKTP